MASPEQVTLQQVVDQADAELRAFLELEVRASRLTPAEATALMAETLPGWAGQYEDAAAATAADLYEQRRFAAGVDQVVPYQIKLAEPVDAARWGALAGWAFTPTGEDLDLASAFAKIVGGAHRTIADAHRNTTLRNSTADPAARGWQRVGRGGSTCDFCRMLIDRGQVYTESSVKFRSHDHCRCAAETAFRSVNSAEMNAYKASARKGGWTDRQREGERARVREWLRMDAEANA